MRRATSRERAEPGPGTQKRRGTRSFFLSSLFLYSRCFHSLAATPADVLVPFWLWRSVASVSYC